MPNTKDSTLFKIMSDIWEKFGVIRDCEKKTLLVALILVKTGKKFKLMIAAPQAHRREGHMLTPAGAQVTCS